MCLQAITAPQHPLYPQQAKYLELNKNNNNNNKNRLIKPNEKKESPRNVMSILTDE